MACTDIGLAAAGGGCHHKCSVLCQQQLFKLPCGQGSVLGSERFLLHVLCTALHLEVGEEAAARSSSLPWMATDGATGRGLAVHCPALGHCSPQACAVQAPAEGDTSLCQLCLVPCCCSSGPQAQPRSPSSAPVHWCRSGLNQVDSRKEFVTEVLCGAPAAGRDQLVPALYSTREGKSSGFPGVFQDRSALQ